MGLFRPVPALDFFQKKKSAGRLQKEKVRIQCAPLPLHPLFPAASLPHSSHLPTPSALPATVSVDRSSNRWGAPALLIAVLLEWPLTGDWAIRKTGNLSQELSILATGLESSHCNTSFQK